MIYLIFTCDNIHYKATSMIYRITAVLKFETDIIIASNAAGPTGEGVILVIMYVKIFKTGVIVFYERYQNVFE